jgi:hypothetical protein
MSPRKQAVADGTAIDTKQSKARKATKHTAPGNDPVRRRRKDAAPGPDTVPAAAPQSGPVNEAEAYGVRVATAEVEPGAEYWRLVKVRHLTPLENQGKHNAFVDAVDENGLRVRDPNLRIGWTWEGRSPEEQAEPKRLDKPDDEAAERPRREPAHQPPRRARTQRGALEFNRPPLVCAAFPACHGTR